MKPELLVPVKIVIGEGDDAVESQFTISIPIQMEIDHVVDNHAVFNLHLPESSQVIRAIADGFYEAMSRTVRD